MFILQTFMSIFPILLYTVYLETNGFGTVDKISTTRKVTGYGLGLLWAIAFGAFCGLTGFLR